MKKKLLSSIAVLAFLAMGVACSNVSSSSAPSSVGGESSVTSSETSSSEAPSSEAPDSSTGGDSSSTGEEYPDATIRFTTGDTVSVEEGYSTAIRASVSTSATNKMVSYTVDDPTIVQLPANTVGSTISIKGLKVGTATITATAVANPNVSVTCTVNVIAGKPTLSQLFTNLQTVDNYTIHTEMTGTGQDGEELTIVEEAQVTDKALIRGYRGPDATSFSSLYSLGQDVGVSRYGLQVADNGEVVYLDYTEDGNVVTAAERAKNSSGFLTADNFTGVGVTSYGSQNTYFVGLAANSPTFFSGFDKRSDNTYTINGTEDDYASMQAELMLLNSCSQYFTNMVIQTVVDPQTGSYYLTDVASAVETTIEVLGNTDFRVTFTDADLGLTAVSTLTNVGTTTITNVPATYAEDVASLEPVTPELNPDLVKGINALRENNYIRSGSYSFTSLGGPSFTLTDYYTPDYMASSILDLASYRNLNSFMAGYGVDLSDPLQAGDYLGSMVAYVKSDDKVYMRYIGYAGIENDGTAEASLSYVYSEEMPFEIYNVEDPDHPFQANRDEFYQVMSYVGTSEVLDDSYLYAFSDSEEQVFNGVAGFSTDSLEIGVGLASTFGLLEQILEEAPDVSAFKTVLDFTTDNSTGDVTGASIYIAFSTDGNSYSVFQMSLSGIGTATDNPFNDDVVAMIADEYVEGGEEETEPTEPEEPDPAE